MLPHFVARVKVVKREGSYDKPHLFLAIGDVHGCAGNEISREDIGTQLVLSPSLCSEPKADTLLALMFHRQDKKVIRLCPPPVTTWLIGCLLCVFGERGRSTMPQ